MFASRYFNPRYWASRYWPKIGATVLISTPTVVIIKIQASNNVINVQESDRAISITPDNRRIIF